MRKNSEVGESMVYPRHPGFSVDKLGTLGHDWIFSALDTLFIVEYWVFSAVDALTTMDCRVLQIPFKSGVPEVVPCLKYRLWTLLFPLPVVISHDTNPSRNVLLCFTLCLVPVMGKAEGRKELWHGHVTAVTVAPEYRRLGVAKQLMDSLETVCIVYIFHYRVA